MRTTIDLDDELLRTVRAISESSRRPISRVVSDLAWKGLRPELPSVPPAVRNGFPVLESIPASGQVTPEHVKEMAAGIEDGKLAAGLLP